MAPGRSATARSVRRARALTRLVALRTRLAVLQRTAPERAARLVIELWSTPPTGDGRRRDDRTRPGRTDSVRLDDGTRVTVETWGDPARPAVYLVHGWGGWRGQLGAFVDPLLTAGFRVVALDCPGHGDSDPGFLGPGRGAPVEMAESLRAVARVHGEPVGVVAHSLGTAVATLAVRDGMPAARLVLVSAIDAPSGQLPALGALLRLTPVTLDRVRARIEEVVRRPMTDLDTVTSARAGLVPPALLVHDRQDKEVPYDVAARLAQEWPGGELLTTDGLGHHRLLRDEGVVAAVTAYLSGTLVGAEGAPAG